MNRILAILSAVLCVMTALCSCSAKKETNDPSSLQIVCTIFPQYDFAKAVAGNRAEVVMLVPAGSEVHGYEPTMSDLKRIHECDLFLYCSGESESWVTDILSSVDCESLDIHTGVDLYEEEDPSDAIPDESEEHDHEHEDEVAYDEHVWASPVNAIQIVQNIAQALSRVDPQNRDEYQANAASYIEQLEELDQSFREAFDRTNNPVLIVADRFPFRYLTEEYGVEYYAAFNGCSSKTEPTLATLNFLIKKVQEKKVSTVFYIEMSDRKTADILCAQTGCNKRMLHSCQNVTKEEFESGVTYLQLMQGNAQALKEAFCP